MKPQLFENYKFESQVIEGDALSPVNDVEMIRVPEDGSVHSYPLKLNFLGRSIDKLKILPFSTVGVTTAGFVEIYEGSNLIGRFLPWSYVKTIGLSQIYVDDETVYELNRQRIKAKKCGIWYGSLGNKTIVRWRHFFRPSSSTQNYALQYEFECVFHSTGMIEFLYPSLTSLFTGATRELVEGGENLASIGARCRNDGITSGTNKIQVIDLSMPTVTTQDEFLGGFRTKSNTLTRTIAYYDHSLQYTNWPGRGNTGVSYRFIPPSQEIKKTLPRRVVRNKAIDESVPGTDKFDDRKSVNFDAITNVSMPTGLPFLFGQGSTFRTQDFSSESDLRIARTVNPRDILNFPKEDKGIQPFNESQHLEIDLVGTNFYLTGTSIHNNGLGFEGGMHQKTKFVYEFPVETSKELPGEKASFYLYDSRTKTFHGTTSSLPNTENPDELWVNMFGDSRLFSAFGTQTFSVYKGNSENPNRLFPKEWETKDSLKDVLEIARHHDSRYHLNRCSNPEIDFGEPEEVGIQPLIFNNDFSAPFLLQKICIEIPIEAGPGWFNDRTVALNYGSQIDTQYTKYDAGGPCITVGLIKESKNKKLSKGGYRYQPAWNSPLIPDSWINDPETPQFTNREVIASCALIPSGDEQKGYFYCSYDITRLSSQENTTAFNVQLVPSGFNFYSNVQKQILVPNQDNSFTGSVKLHFEPQNSSIFYYSKSTNESVDNPATMYDLDNQYVNIYQKNKNGILVKLENFKLPTISGVNLSDNRNVLGCNQIFYDERISVESQWNQFDKASIYSEINQIIDASRQEDFAPIKPPIFYGEKEPLLFSENYVSNSDIHVLGGIDSDPVIEPLASTQAGDPPVGGFPNNSWESGAENVNNSKQYFNLSVSNAGMIGIFTNNPYLLMPGDKLALFVSKHRPVLTKIKSNLGGYVEFDTPEGVGSKHDVKISTGKIRLTLHGSYIKEGKEWNSNTDVNSNCEDRVKTFGDEPVLDQFEVYHNLDLLGTYQDNWVFPISDTLFVRSKEVSPNLTGYTGVGENRMRLYGSSYGKLQANFKDSETSIGKTGDS